MCLFREICYPLHLEETITELRQKHDLSGLRDQGFVAACQREHGELGAAARRNPTIHISKVSSRVTCDISERFCWWLRFMFIISSSQKRNGYILIVLSRTGTVSVMNMMIKSTENKSLLPQGLVNTKGDHVIFQISPPKNHEINSSLLKQGQNLSQYFSS